MAPKKGKQKELNVQDVEKEVPKPLKPTLDNLPFLESLLAQAKESVESWPQQLALALNVHDYYIDMKSSILVDLFFNYLTFAVQNQFSTNKTRTFIQEMEELRAMLIKGESVESITRALKTQLLVHAKPPPPPPPVQEVPEVEEDQEKDKKGKGKPKGKGDDKDPAPQEKEKEEIEEFVHYTVADVSRITDFVVRGLLQHCKLYRHCFGEDGDREESSIGTFKAFVETCAVPLKLQKALPEQQYLERLAAAKIEKEEADCKRIQDHEEKLQLEQKMRAEQEAEEERIRKEEEEKASHKMSISNEEAKVLVECAASDVQSALDARRKQILQRIMALEEKVGIGAS